jgi:SnoaL-like domain
MEAVHAYGAVWSERDPERRSRLLSACWTDESEIIGPGYYFKGTREVLDEIERFHREQPETTAVRTSDIDQHGRWIRFTVAVLGPHGAVLNEGWDVIELRADGKIARVITFWGRLSAVEH